jgi:predicted component of type VI protein secretion system
MKLNLTVLTPGKWQSKVIPITLSQFVIGRDPGCHLRPASPAISKRHCALLVRGGQVFLHDFNSTNGTFLNDRQVKGEIEVQNGDRLKAGPLEFAVQLETTPAINRPTPLPAKLAVAGGAEDEAAALLLLAAEGEPRPALGGLDDSTNVPLGGTVLIEPPPGPPAAAPAQAAAAPAAKPTVGDTSSAAKAVLEKYLRRNR